MSLVVPPYPPPRYTAEEPEISAWLKRGDEAPDATFGSVDYRYLASQQETKGDYGLYRIRIGPKGGGPGPHYHRGISEAFYVLSGTVRLYDGTQWVDGNADDYLYVPPGGVHAFRNDAEEPVSMLMLFAPGAPREHYFEGLSQVGELSDDERAEWFFNNDNHWVE